MCYQNVISECVSETSIGESVVTPIEDTKVIEGKGRFINRPTKTGKGVYDKFFVYVPTEIARDGLFPFHEGDEVTIRIDSKKKRLTVE